MEPVFSQIVRIGGSHAQREVFEDTMLEAFIRAEQFEKAEDMLRRRLGQRTSARDTFWLGRVQSSKHQVSEAKCSVNDAKKGWRDGNPDAPELDSLNRLLFAVE